MQGSEVAVYRFASTPVPWVGFTNPRQRLRCRVAIKSQDKSVTLSVIIIIPIFWLASLLTSSLNIAFLASSCSNHKVTYIQSGMDECNKYTEDPSKDPIRRIWVFRPTVFCATLTPVLQHASPSTG